MFSDDACGALLQLIEQGAELRMQRGLVRGVRSSLLSKLEGDQGKVLQPRRGSAEQSNSSILFGDRLILKLFRRQQPGPNPDTEIGEYLAGSTSFDHTAPFGGSIEYLADGSAGSGQTFAMLQGLVANEGDGWQWSLEELERYYEACAEDSSRGVTSAADSIMEQQARGHAGIYLDAARTLGKRTAELHLALGSETDNPAFKPEMFSKDEMRALGVALHSHAIEAFELLKDGLAQLPEELVGDGGLVLSRRRAILERLREISNSEISALKTRVHGDYHLGQVLRVRSDFVILDFEGEPARSLAERRLKQSPLKDVAGMVRSFSYAAYAALMRYTSRRPEQFDQLEPWARLWEKAVSDEFLRAYREIVAGSKVVPESADDFQKMLEAFLLDKVLYELTYELNNRPGWVGIPIRGILALSSGQV